MLQQTQATRVIPHYRRFMRLYPTPSALARAPLSDVLAVWSGLGYNRRALALHEAAKHITSEGWPTESADLQMLPGVGPYTAAAVACFAFGEQLPTIDTNLRRVLSRWTGQTLEGKDLDEFAVAELPTGRATDWNQAVMDLGSLICRPSRPSCADCPVNDWCAGPDSYVPPRPQGHFRGSVREARGAVISTLVEMDGAATAAELVARTGLAPSRIDEAVQGLTTDGLVTVYEDRFSLPGT
jgi:A/G-specific adenine glycosylase